MLNIEDGPGKPGQVPAAGVQPETYPDISGPRKSREMAARLAGKASFKLAFL